MHHFIIGQFVRYKMTSKMATKTALFYILIKNTLLLFLSCTKPLKWENKAHTLLNIILLHIYLMYTKMTSKGR